ncbi:PREDICTED: uncharacterized protein At1g43920, Chloroplastic-like [Brassica oleracea var. oleracea]|uniref:uncharacterized protein At1g43920, Chloroplastic-like n=1 Tax=Brassica oleracea var. oleracea TaxID=109376 RepID=UPI0006A6A16B|nr:PREDICTED: uncharacterized protein At1g43920, Chloroplastic-like [Brassica oleracea var. oleracea]
MKTSCSANSGDMKSRSMSEEGEIHATKYSSMSEEDEIRGFPTKCLCGRLRVDHLFKWVEDAIYEEVEDALPRVGNLEIELSNVKADVEELKCVIHEMKDELVCHKREIKKFKVISKTLLVLTLFLSIAMVYMFLATFGLCSSQQHNLLS